MMEVKKTERMATIYDGHSHIERRVYEDKEGRRYVKINGFLCKITDLMIHNGFEVDIWYDG